MYGLAENVWNSLFVGVKAFLTRDASVLSVEAPHLSLRATPCVSPPGVEQTEQGRALTMALLWGVSFTSIVWHEVSI